MGIKGGGGGTEWQLQLSGVHSITMKKLAQPDEGGGARPPSFTISIFM